MTENAVRSTVGGRFVALDTMRGVAALVVVFVHSAGLLGGAGPRFGYLAVDLFFVLSGFVIARSNDRQFALGMTTGSFMRKRFVRLLPMFLLGWLISLAALPFEHLAPASAIAAIVFNGLMLPSFFQPHASSLFPTNEPVWSLFFELFVANLFFSVAWKWVHGWKLAAIVAACALALLINERVFYTINVGWSRDTLAAGVARVGFSFFAGVALYRLHLAKEPKLRMPSWIPVIIMLAAFFAPLTARPSHVFELACIFLIFPALVYWGAEAKENIPIGGKILGEASYAVYAIHFPIIVIFLGIAAGWPPLHTLGTQIALVICCGGLGLAAAKIEQKAKHHIYLLLFRQPTEKDRPIDARLKMDL